MKILKAGSNKYHGSLISKLLYHNINRNILYNRYINKITFYRYIKSGGYLTEVLVRGAGHLVPMDKPAETTELISYFIRGIDMKLPPNYQVLPQDTPPYVNDEFEGISKTIYQYPEAHSSSGTKVAMVISVILNVLLVLGIVCGIVYALRWKRRNDTYMYNTMEDNNIVSTMF